MAAGSAFVPIQPALSSSHLPNQPRVLLVFGGVDLPAFARAQSTPRPTRLRRSGLACICQSADAACRGDGAVVRATTPRRSRRDSRLGRTARRPRACPQARPRPRLDSRGGAPPSRGGSRPWSRRTRRSRGAVRRAIPRDGLVVINGHENHVVVPIPLKRREQLAVRAAVWNKSQAERPAGSLCELLEGLDGRVLGRHSLVEEVSPLAHVEGERVAGHPLAEHIAHRRGHGPNARCDGGHADVHRCYEELGAVRVVEDERVAVRSPPLAKDAIVSFAAARRRCFSARGSRANAAAAADHDVRVNAAADHCFWNDIRIDAAARA